MSVLRGLATLLVALTIALVLGLLVIGTPSGSAWLLGNLADLAGNRLSLTGVRGTLLEGLEIERLQISAGRTTIVIEPAELSMSWPDLLRRRVRLTTARAAMVRIDIAPRPPDEPDSQVEPLLLPVTVAADALEIERLVIRNGINQDESSAAGIVPVELGPVTLRGELVDGVLEFESLSAELFGISAKASGTFGTGEPFALDAQLKWQLADPAVTGSGALTGDLAALRFEQVVLLPSPVGVGGVAHLLQDQPEIVAEARWADLQRPLGKDPDLLLRSDAGRLRIRGWTNRFVAEVNAGVRLGDWPKAQASATVEGDARQLELRGILVDVFGGQVTGTGRITLPDAVAGQDNLTGNLQLQGRGIDPRFLDPRFAGRVDVRSAIDFDSAGNFRVQVPEASGTLFKRPLRASGTVARNPQGLSFDDVRVHAGVNRLEFSGQLSNPVTGPEGAASGQRLAGSFRIDAPDLATLWPDYSGQLRGTGTLAGTTAQPSLDLDLAGSNLVTGELRIQSLQARGGVGNRQRLTLDVDSEGLSWTGRPLGNLSLRVAGSLEAQTVEVALVGGDVEARLSAAGTYKNGIVTQTIGTGLVTVKGNDRWTLREPATVRVAGSDVRLTAHCWISGETELCLSDARYDPRGFSGGLDLRNLSLARLAPWLPADIGLTGTAAGAVTVQREGGRLTGTLNAGLQDALITWRVPEDEDVQTEISEFRVSAALADDVLAFEAAVAESFGLRLAATGRVTNPLGETPTIVADLTGGVPDLASLGPLIERLVDVADIKGSITVAASLSGNARQPDISGGLQLDEGAFTVPAAGITVDRISLALEGRDDGQVALKGNARSGKGYVALDGTLAWRDQLVPTAEATVKGRVFDVIRLPQGLVQVSPDVRVVLREGQFHVSGDMVVPRAEIRLKKLEQSGVQVSPDTIVHDREVVSVERKPPLFVLDDLQVTLGKNVSFEGFGLKTGLAGGLLLNQSVGADVGLVSGSGVISLRDGQFSAFGQKLAIERGSLLFSGVVTDPGLDVKASREVTYEGRNVTVGVLLSGRLSRIETRVFSEPAMGELDALSYLTTGKPLSAAGVGDRYAVSNAAISLGLNQALPVVQQLGSALSVDEIGLDTTAAGGTAVMVGEQLGKNLFIRYSYGIFDKLGTLKATYKLGRRISIEGSSGEAQAQALDLIYSINW